MSLTRYEPFACFDYQGFLLIMLLGNCRRPRTCPKKEIQMLDSVVDHRFGSETFYDLAGFFPLCFPRYDFS